MRRKLVRDNIPEIVGMYDGHVSGRRATFTKADPDDLQEALETKLQEEAAKFLLSPTAEELADILEVVEALKLYYPEVDQVRKTNALQKGRFRNGWLMELAE